MQTAYIYIWLGGRERERQILKSLLIGQYLCIEKLRKESLDQKKFAAF